MTTVLVTGATGSIGRLLTARLLARGVGVRALSRDASTAVAALPDHVAVVEGSLATAPDEIFEGLDAVFLFPAPDGVDSFVQRAIAAGISRVVVLSSLAVSGRQPRDLGSASEQHHRAVELAVSSRTADFTMLRPGNLANNLLSWSFPIRSGFPVRMPYPASSQVLTHEADVADAAAIVLTEPGHEGQVYEITGPESLTKVEQLSAIADAIGHEITHVEVSPEAFRADVAAYITDDIIDMLLRYWSETIVEPEVPIDPPLGLTPRPLAQWARDHRAAFIDRGSV